MSYRNSITDDLHYRFHIGNMVVKLIFVNVAVFLLVNILKLIFFLFQNSSAYQFILYKLSLPASVMTLIEQPWTLFSYMFLHEDFFHILFNMLWLFWFGEIFVLYLGDKKILPLYLLGGIMGALLYIASFNLIPVFAARLQTAVLMGASASVLAIVFGAVTLNPDHRVQLIFIGDVRIKYIALFTLVLDIISIPRGNAGGYIAHLGGALCGWLFIRGLRSGIDASRPITNFTDAVAEQFNDRNRKKDWQAKSQPGSKESAKKASADVAVASEQERLDEILDKISRSGYDSLTDEEKKFLFDYSKK